MMQQELNSIFFFLSSVGPSRPDELYIEQIQEIMNDILHSGLVDVVEQ